MTDQHPPIPPSRWFQAAADEAARDAEDEAAREALLGARAEQGKLVWDRLAADAAARRPKRDSLAAEVAAREAAQADPPGAFRLPTNDEVQAKAAAARAAAESASLAGLYERFGTKRGVVLAPDSRTTVTLHTDEPEPTTPTADGDAFRTADDPADLETPPPGPPIASRRTADGNLWAAPPGTSPTDTDAWTPVGGVRITHPALDPRDDEHPLDGMFTIPDTARLTALLAEVAPPPVTHDGIRVEVLPGGTITARGRDTNGPVYGVLHPDRSRIEVWFLPKSKAEVLHQTMTPLAVSGWTANDLLGAVRRVIASSELDAPPDRVRIRRYRLPGGRLLSVQVNAGPPTWWLPRVRVGRNGWSAGWLRRLVIVDVSPEVPA